MKWKKNLSFVEKREGPRRHKTRFVFCPQEDEIKTCGMMRVLMDVLDHILRIACGEPHRRPSPRRQPPPHRQDVYRHRCQKALKVFLCLGLFAYHFIRFLVVVILQTFGIHLSSIDEMWTFELSQWLYRRPVLTVWIIKSIAFLYFGWKSIPAICGMISVDTDRLPVDDMWYIFSQFVTLSRIATGREALDPPAQRLLWTNPISLRICKLVTFSIRLVVLSLVVSFLLPSTYLSMEYRPLWYPWAGVNNLARQPRSGSSRGFTAVITSCYDGDTCYATDLSHNGRILPAPFSDIRIRIRHIDAPEMRGSQCPMEKCLAYEARKVLEDFLQTGKGQIRQLIECGKDKYGDRLLCDILDKHGNSAAQAMLSSGLAVPYEGKRKASSWCDLDEAMEESHTISTSRSELDRHIVDCIEWIHKEW